MMLYKVRIPEITPMRRPVELEQIMPAKMKMPKKPDMLEIEKLCRAANCLKVLAHPHRLRMVEILMQGQFPVNTIAQLCDLPPHQACEHLRLMQSHNLLGSVRNGRTVYYRISNPNLPEIIRCIRKNCRG